MKRIALFANFRYRVTTVTTGDRPLVPPALSRSTCKSGQKRWRSFGAAFTMVALPINPVSAAFRLL